MSIFYIEGDPFLVCLWLIQAFIWVFFKTNSYACTSYLIKSLNMNENLKHVTQLSNVQLFIIYDT